MTIWPIQAKPDRFPALSVIWPFSGPWLSRRTSLMESSHLGRERPTWSTLAPLVGIPGNSGVVFSSPRAYLWFEGRKDNIAEIENRAGYLAEIFICWLLIWARTLPGSPYSRVRPRGKESYRELRHLCLARAFLKKSILRYRPPAQETLAP